ncbi:hypothetical protein EBZ39_18130 [bacterium]|nr:hypothetical protein [bacterium]
MKQRRVLIVLLWLLSAPLCALDIIQNATGQGLFVWLQDDDASGPFLLQNGDACVVHTERLREGVTHTVRLEVDTGSYRGQIVLGRRLETRIWEARKITDAGRDITQQVMELPCHQSMQVIAPRSFCCTPIDLYVYDRQEDEGYLADEEEMQG